MSVPAEWKYWAVLDPRTVMVGTVVWLGVLAVLIHVLVLATSRYNWFDNGTGLTPIKPPVSKSILTPPAVTAVPTPAVK
jgi:light-harvesting complex 1 alpha chain